VSQLDRIKVAIVCDWLTGIGGAERVVYELHKLFPDAPIYTSQYDIDALPWLKEADIRVGYLQKLPKSLKKFLPVLRAWTFSRLQLSEYDLVISSSGAEAKGIKTTASTTHICYCHSPTHYYWSRYNDYLSNPGFGKLLDPLARIGLKILVGPMRKWDFRAAQRPDYILANSSHTQQEIDKYYKRQSTVINPPVDIERFSPHKEETKSGFVIAGRQTPYKKIDLAVKSCAENNILLTVVGDGPQHKFLESIASNLITFKTNVPDSEVPEYFHRSKAFIFPGLDDFGIVAVEALAAGIPVIAFRGGGASDYIIPGLNGEFFDEQTVNSLSDKLNKFRSEKYQSSKIIQSVLKFSQQEFRSKTLRFIKEKLG
jgi:glycosyltransferase involved in cell wall biosynthesis